MGEKIPDFDADGDLPPGIHHTSVEELWARFGNRGPQRTLVSECLRKIIDLAAASGKVERLIIFGSYVTKKLDPGDVDLLLIVSADFEIKDVPQEAQILFDHQRAEREINAHIFWLRNNVGQEIIDGFIHVYATSRNGKLRGVIEL